jgi:hypothetical protein
MPTPPRVLIIACGALARELLAINELNGLDNVTIECLPASLHNRPSLIPELVRQRIHRARGVSPKGSDTAGDAGDNGADTGHNGADGEVSDAALVDEDVTFGTDHRRYDEILIGYADCGTGGALEAVCAQEGVEMLAGAHCYQFFATAEGFEKLQDHTLGSFYLTDFLARNFHRLVWQGLGIEKHPELRDMYFGNYTRLVYLEQTGDPKARACAEDAAARLGMELHVERTGYGELESSVVEFTRKVISR